MGARTKAWQKDCLELPERQGCSETQPPASAPPVLIQLLTVSFECLEHLHLLFIKTSMDGFKYALWLFVFHLSYPFFSFFLSSFFYHISSLL